MIRRVRRRAIPLRHRVSLPRADGLYWSRIVSSLNSLGAHQGGGMKSHSRLLALAVLVSLLAPLSVIAQGPPPPPPQAIEQFVARLRDGLKLNDEQLHQLRQVLSQHESKYLELRRRAQTNPYQP